MNRAELQQLAEDRILDAQALLAAGRWSAAYYLAGYAVECGLKSCVLKLIIETGAVFKDKRFSEKCFTHDLESLVVLAELNADQARAMKANPAFAANWQAVIDWSEISRYRVTTAGKARKLFEAICDPQDGVMTWVRANW